jgi:hypothetical protein
VLDDSIGKIETAQIKTFEVAMAAKRAKNAIEQVKSAAAVKFTDTEESQFHCIHLTIVGCAPITSRQ